MSICLLSYLVISVTGCNISHKKRRRGADVIAYLRNHTDTLHQFLCILTVQSLAQSSSITLLKYVTYFGFVEDVVFSRDGPYGDSRVFLTSERIAH